MRKRRAIAVSVTPAILLVAACALFVAGSQRSPSRFVLELAWAAPDWQHPFGSGEAGVDLTAAVAHATWRVLVLAVIVATVGFTLGTPLGAIAGLVRGRTERSVLRACDLVQSFPTFLLALAVLSAVRSPSRAHIGAVFCLTAWAPFARMAAAQAHVLATSQFVEAARALGATRARVIAIHIVPNLLGPVAIQVGSVAAGVVLGETALAFVGLGPPDGVSLGALLDQGTVAMLRAPHVLVVSACAVLLVSGSLQLASEGLRRWVSSGTTRA
jgi:peptide/nickel transport system permease protein